MILEISVAVIALAWVLLVIYLIITLTQLKTVLQSSNRTIEKTEPLIETSKDIAENLLEKSKALDPAFHSISQLSQSADDLVTRFKKSEKEASYTDKKSSNLEDIIELAAMGMLLWSKYKKKE